MMTLYDRMSEIARKLFSDRQDFSRMILTFFAPWCLALAIAVAILAGGTRASAQSAPSAPKAEETQSGNAENGRKLFVKYGCYECHGREAQGGGLNGPRLAPNPGP